MHTTTFFMVIFISLYLGVVEHTAKFFKDVEFYSKLMHVMNYL